MNKKQGEIGLGWMRFTCPHSYFNDVLSLLKKHFKADLVCRNKGWNGYLMSWVGVHSIMIGLTPCLTQEQRLDLGIKKSPNEGYMTVDIPQTALDGLNWNSHFPMWLDLMTIDGINFRRIDVYYDDYERLIRPLEIKKGIEAGKIGVPRFAQMKAYEQVSLRDLKSQGETVYFGSPKSCKQVRIYDKEQESGGEKKCDRYEVQFTDAKAEAFQRWMLEVLEVVLDCPCEKSASAGILAGYKSALVGSIDFIDISDVPPDEPLPSNWASRFPRSDWWQKIVDGVRAAKLSVPKVRPSLESQVHWLRSQVMPALALVRTAYRNWSVPWNAWLERELEKGEERWSERHWNILGEAFLVSPAT